ncbi:hypothetical protein SteCoe_19430 [Stentor coeruleus]|uniref:Uncharacterized protein n=1 Tax=Stentor coeruleus TaxID=5963 RepID=A0A1R2BU42_9CILI|nr:hypothetical protein SteCoe_19430 [Stentor coeruleus]
MVKVELIEPGSFSVKLLTFYLVLLADVGTNCFSYYVQVVEYSDFDTSYNDQDKESQMGLIILAVQGVLQLIIICWIFLLVWKTFLFKYGLIGILCGEFKVLFISLPIHLLLFGLEKGLRFVLASNEGPIKLWDHPGYEIVYWVRSIFMVYFYLLLFELSLDLGDPVYYKADKWLEVNR